MAQNSIRSKSGNIIGPRVKQARRSRVPTLSQEALSGRLAARGVTIGRAGIAKIESGRRAVSDYEIVGIAHALSVPITWLLDGKPVDGKYSTDGKYRHGRDAGGKSSGGR